MGRYKKLGKNVGLLVIGNFSSKILGFILVPLYTTVLSTTEYGISDLIVTVISLVYPIFTLLISEAVLRFALDKDKNSKQIFSIGLYIVISGFLIMLLFSPLILIFEDLRPYFGFYILCYLSITISNFISSFIRGIEKINLYTISGVINSATIILFNILFLLYFNLGLVGYIWSIIIGHLVTVIFLFIAARLDRYLLSFSSIDKVLLKSMIKYSVPMIPNSISWWISNSSDKYMLTAFCGVAVTGIYSVAYKIPTILTMFTTIFMSAWQISAVEGFGTEETRKFYSDIHKKYTGVTILTTSFIIMIIKILAKVLFAKDFYQAWSISPILLFAFLFGTMSSFFGSIYTSAKKTKMLFYSAITGAGLNIVLNLLMIPLLKGIGAAVATLVSYMVVWLIRLIHTRKIMIIDIDYKSSFLCYILIAFQTVVVFLDLAFSGIFSVCIFVVLMIIQHRTIKDLYVALVCFMKCNKAH